MSSDDSVARIKAAASQLVRGGTLTSEPCAKCGGVQVRFADKTTCIKCGNEVKAAAKLKAEEGGTKSLSTQQAAANLAAAGSMIEEKILLLAAEIRAEQDIALQRQMADLLEIYLRILEKTRNLFG
jgi:uncharacterized Zn finger protein (UPF0148 family)